MNRNNTLPKRLKLWNYKEPKRNSGAEEFNKWDFFNILESTGNRTDHMGDRISELEYRNLDMPQVRERVMIFFNEEILKELSIRKGKMCLKGNIRIMGIPEREEREKGAESLFKQIIAENFPNLWKKLDMQVN